MLTVLRVIDVSFSGLHDIFSGRLGSNYCVKSFLYLKSPQNARKYLTAIHKITFKDGDRSRDEKWQSYPQIKDAPPVTPIREKELSSPIFMNKQSDKLSFDISRFTEFLSGYDKVKEDIKPVMLHYAMIYLLDFFSRTWLKYGQNRGHGIKLTQPELSENEKHALNPLRNVVKIEKKGIFPRAVDAFYFLGQSSLFSPDDDDGIGYLVNPLTGGPISERIEKMKYSDTPVIPLSYLIHAYEKLDRIAGQFSKSNPILVGYVILFTVSSICRYKAEDWFKIREDRNLKSKLELLQHDFLYEWIPEILIQTILRKGLKEELQISDE